MKAENVTPWRPTLEVYAAVGWGAALLGTGIAATLTKAPFTYSGYMMAASAVGLAWRSYQTKRHFDFKLAISGINFWTLPMQECLDKREEGKLWLGKGWDWKPKHTARAIEARKIDVIDMLPPRWYLKLMKIPAYEDVVGMPWIHGLEPEEKDVQIQLGALEGHNLVIGTTGSGKTRLLETVVTQYVARGDIVILIDPKGDQELEQIAKRACVVAKRPKAFVKFHPAFAKESIRFDPCKNWTRETQIASRISMLMDTGSGSDSFVQFAWRAINSVNEGLLYLGQRPNLKVIKKYVAGGPEGLMEKVFVEFFNRKIPNWESLVEAYIQKAANAKTPSKIQGATPELLGYIQFFKTQVPESERDETVCNLLEITEHPREHYSKVITNVLPLLTMLTSGEIGEMLSPDASNIKDTRPIFDSKKIIEGGHVLYMGLDSLSDPTVGSAVAGIVLAELAALAGELYNYGTPNNKRPIQLIVDEAAEVVNAPMVQLLNKARGAGFVIWLLTQTYPDFVAKMGNEAKARQILGNCNNLIALRTKDRITQDFIVETFGETHVKQISTSFSTGARTQDSGLDHTGSISQSVSEQKVAVFPPELLGMLPPLNYIAMVAGGRVIKGRLPKLA